MKWFWLAMGVIACILMVYLASVYDIIKEHRRQKRKLQEQMQQQNKDAKEEIVIQETNCNKDIENNMGTRDLFLRTLTNIGCQYELGEGEDNRIYFAYQGEHFVVDTTNESLYVRIWDTHWGHVELYDVDEVARLRKAINTSNLNTSVTTVFTIDEAGNNMDVHTKSTIPFISTMPDLEDYLRAELDSFFRAHQIVGSEMHKLREEEKNV